MDSVTAEIYIENFSRFCGPLESTLLLVSSQGMIHAANPAARALATSLGVELVDVQLTNLVVDPVDDVEHYLGQCARSRELVPGSLTFRLADRSEQTYRVEGAVVRPRLDATPALILLLCRPQNGATRQLPVLNQKLTALSTALAEQRRVEEELGAQCESLQFTLSSIGDGVIATQSDGLVTFVNPAAEKLTGWLQSEALGKPLHEVFHIINEVTREPADNSVALVLQQGKVIAFANHTVLIPRRGVAWPLEGCAAPIRDHKDHILGVILTFREVSRRLEEQRRRDEILAREKAVRLQAQKTNRMKDDFLATLSHELRTPLSAITGWVMLIKQNELEADQVQHGLEVIERSVKAQTQLINDLLDVTRILSGRLSVDFKPVNLISVIAAALDSVQVQATAKGFSLRTQLDGDASLVQGDPARLQQVIWNLLHNSVKFTPAGGRIELRLEREEAAVKFTVTDNGIGIAPELLPGLFERLRQPEASNLRRHSGLGLGLALVRELTELQGGTVTAESPGTGKGTSVTIRLPPRTTPLSASEFPMIQRHTTEMPILRTNQLAGLNILLVEDDLDSREIIRLALEGGGAKVAEASSVARAKELLAERVPDVLVSDIGLPEEDGFALIKYVRALPRVQGGLVPALALTAFARNIDAERAIQDGFHLHLAKPVAPTDLVNAVAQLAGRA